MTTLHQKPSAGGGGLLSNMSTAVRDTSTLSIGQTLQVPPYAVVTLKKKQKKKEEAV